MLECNRFVKKKMTMLTRVVSVLIVVSCLVLLLSQTAFAKNTYVINDGDRVLIHTTYATDPAEVLDEAGLELGKDDTYTTQPGIGMSEITVQRKQQITIYHSGKTLQVSSYGESVESLLNRLDLILTKEDVVSVSGDTITYDGMEITISRTLRMEETYTVLIPFETVYCYDASLEEGQQQVLTPGVDGQLLCTAAVVYVDGVETDRFVTSELVTRQPVAQVIAIGTYVEQEKPAPMPTASPATTAPVITQPAPTEPAPVVPTPTEPVEEGMPVIGDGIIVTPDGEVLTYTGVMKGIATAYSCNGEPGITYTGTEARVGAIAVDPTVIPLGTRMYIVTDDGEYIYGIATAEDIGGAIKGKKVDLYFNTFDECWIFGIRDITIYFLG